MTRALATIVIGLFLAGCGKHYWEARGRGAGEFQTDSGQCIQEAKSKYEVSERIYRRCMQARGWERVQTNYPSYDQFRGPEDEDEFFSPPNPLSARGAPASGRVDDPACVGPMAARPLHCTRPTQEITSTAAPVDFRTWLPGNWDGRGGGYHLSIASNLDWDYTSTVKGRWYARGTARIEGPATVVLEGWFDGTPSFAGFERLTMVLHRDGESLAGEFRLSRTWLVTFSRSPRPATK